MAQLSPDIVEDLLWLSSPAVAVADADADADAAPPAVAASSRWELSRRGLQNSHNTCFLNATLQALMACQPFVAAMGRVASALAALDPQLEAISDATSTNTPHAQRAQQHGTEAASVANAIPITHELVAFVAHCRRRAATKQQRQRQQTSPPQHQASTPAASSSSMDAAAVSAPAVASNGDSSVPVATEATSAATADPSSAASSNGKDTAPAAAAAASTAHKPSKPKKSKSKTAAASDDAFLDALLASSDPAEVARKAAEEEERKRARNKKKKEKARAAAAAAKQQPRTEGAAEATGEAEEEEEQLAVGVQRLQPPSTSDDAAQQPVAQKKKKNKKKKVADADGQSADTETDRHAVTAPAAAAADAAAPADATPAAEPEPVEEEEEAVAPEPSPAASTLPPLKQQRRVHRVEDEEPWDIVPAKGKQQQQHRGGKGAAAAGKQKGAKGAQSTSTSAPAASAVAAPASISAAPAAALGVPPSTQPFLPSFPRLLRAFHSHRQGQQEDAQELLQILCENVQDEWNRWTAPWRSGGSAAAAGASAGSLSTGTAASVAASSGSGGDADSEWNEVGKGSRAIRVVSNLSFTHTPLSRLFCGRVRTQLTVQSRAVDTMSFQPFWSLHLDIDDPLAEARREAEEAAVAALGASGAAAARQAKHRRKPVHMSVEKALERYMCPSEITGYRRKGAAPQPSAHSYDPYSHYGAPSAPPSTRALHMHALDSHSLPKILVLHLKRFEHADGVGGAGRQLHKSTKHVQFHRRLHLPPKYLSTAAAAAASSLGAGGSSASGGVHYDLCGVVVHHGHSMAGGHYTAFVRDGSATEPQPSPQPTTAAPTAAATHLHRSKLKGAAKGTPTRVPLRSQGSDDEDSDEESRRGGGGGAAGSQQQQQRSGSADLSADSDLWFHCDDARISAVPAHTVYAQQAYLLFYTLDETHIKGH